MVVESQLLVASRHSPELLEAVPEPLHPIALTIRRAVEERIDRVRGPASDDIANAPLPEIPPYRPAAVALIPSQTVGA
jgi:hypothetical protein